MKKEELISIGNMAIQKLLASGADRAQASVVNGLTEEINVDAGQFSLIRSVYTGGISLKAIQNNKKGTASVNQLDEESVDSAIRECMASASSGDADEAVCIAQKTQNADFTDGVLTADKGTFLDSVILFTEDVAREFPHIMLEQVIATYSKGLHVYMNSNGVQFTEEDGYYTVSVMYSAHDGDIVTSFNSFELQTLNPAERLIALQDARTYFQRATMELNAEPFTGKFVGTALFSPACVQEVIDVITDSFCSDYALIEGTSPWKDKLNQQVADERFTLKVIPHDKRIICGEKITADGYPSQNYTVIENGILKSFCLTEYASRRTGLDRSPSTSGCTEILPGTKSLEEMIQSIENGILICRFSGGEPANNGEFSGVAKNSFLIKNGKIEKPLTETMISGSFSQMLMHIKDIGAEQHCDASSCLPYVSFDGVTVSGKSETEEQ